MSLMDFWIFTDWMYISTSNGSEPRLGSDFWAKSSARMMQFFQKTGIEKDGKNEPIWGLFKNIICKSLILTKNINFFLYNRPKGPFSVKKLVKIGQKPYLGYTRFSAWMHRSPLRFWPEAKMKKNIPSKVGAISSTYG